MDFAVMGTISSFVKQKNLSAAAKYKIRTGQTLTDANGNLTFTNAVSTFDKLRESANTSTTQAKQSKLSRIRQKLKSGQKLSAEELGFLRVNDPKTYKKAKHADEAREELKAELKKAKSKSEAREAMTRAMVKASADAMAELSSLAQGGGNVGGMFGGNSQGGDIFSSGAQSDGGLLGGASMSVGGEITSSSENGAEVSSTENQSLADTNQSIQDSGERATAEISETNPANHDEDKNSVNGAQKNSDDELSTPEDIMEKYTWTIRALEDEWARFTNSDEYKNLPDHLSDKVITKKKFRKLIDVPDRRILNAASAYRKAMNLLQA